MVVQRRGALKKKISFAKQQIRKMDEGPEKKAAKKALQELENRITKMRQRAGKKDVLSAISKNFTREELSRLLTLIEKSKGKKLE